MAAGREQGGRLLGEGQEEVPVPVAHGPELSRRLEAVERVLADGLEQVIADHRAVLLRNHERLVHERGQQVQRGHRPAAAAARHLLHRLEREAALEHAQAPEQRALVVRQELVAPVDGGAQRPVARQRRLVSVREEVEAVREPGGDLLHRENAHARRGKLDRKRDPVQLRAHGEQRGHGGRGHREVGPHPRGPLHEQPHRVGVGKDAFHPVGAALGQRQRGDAPGGLGGEPERGAAHGEHGGLGTAAEHRCRHLGRALEQVLAVVEHHERPPASQVGHRGVERALPGQRPHAERPGQRLLHQLRVRDRREFHEPDAVREPPERVGRGL